MGFLHDRVAAAGHAVDYFCADDIAPRWRGRFGRFAFPLLVRRHAARAARSGQPYDVLNVHEPAALGVSLCRRAIGSPALVATSHGLEERAWQLALEERRFGRPGPSLRSRLIFPATGLWQSRLALRSADFVFCLNLDDRDYLMARYGYRPEQILRLMPGADELYAEAAPARDYAACDRLLFAATWRKNKGVEDLVPAFAALAAKHPYLRLTVLGAGVPADPVRGAFPAAVRDRVECVTTTNEQETAAAFARSDLFLLPSVFEGTPLTLIEAMMSGLPIITTATCGMKDVIRDRQNGLLIPIRSPDALAAAVETLISDAALRRQLGKTARADAVNCYTWDRVAEPVVEFYSRLQASLHR
ncbi:MAG: glycosyltransferase family 4 protein [Gemmataceae bacterium]